MAEVILPVVGLGALYILSNKNKKDSDKILTYSNFVENQNKVNNTTKYNQHTDKYYNENNYVNVSSQKNNFGVGNNNTNLVKSINGNTFDKDEFTHNNMVPFFGAKIKGSTSEHIATESILDNMQGSGSQKISKGEIAPLFSPNDNISNTYGTANNSDFYQSRMNIGNKMSNTTLWDKQQVTPGLNLDYNSNSNLGYNSGISSRELWQPKDVDQLRVDNNPKISYNLTGHEGPANNYIKERGTIGKVEKHLPEKFYDNNPSRWITTNGNEKAQTYRSENIFKDENRENTTTQYFGNGSDNNPSTYASQNYEESKKINLNSLPISNANAVGKANNDNINSYSNLNNNRSTTNNQINFGPVGGLAQAILTPIMDIIRPTRKENVIGNLRENGNVANTVTRGHLLDKNDKPGVTNREMFCNSKSHLNIQGQSGNGYLTSNNELLDNQRQTTSTNYIGNSVSSNMGYKNNELYNNQRNNNNKTYEIHPNMGGTQIFNQQINLNNIRDDSTRNNNRMWVPSDAPKNFNNNYGNDSRGLQSYDEKINNDRINPDILTAFKNNPYTQSLHSVA